MYVVRLSRASSKGRCHLGFEAKARPHTRRGKLNPYLKVLERKAKQEEKANRRLWGMEADKSHILLDKFLPDTDSRYY